MASLVLENICVECVLGSSEPERQRPQPFEIDLELEGVEKISVVPFERRLQGELRFILTAGQFWSAQSAAEALASWLLMPPSADVPRPALSRVRLRLTPRTADGAARPPAVVDRAWGDFRRITESKPFGFVDIVYETRECGVYRERIHPRTVLPTHVHHHLDESELVLGPGLLLQGRPALPGWAHSWPRGFAHRYENVTEIEQSFLCIDRPAFIPTDEVEVDVPLASLERTAATRYF